MIHPKRDLRIALAILTLSLCAVAYAAFGPGQFETSSPRNLGGAMLGGILLGLIEALGAGYVGDFTGGVFGSNYQDVFAFLVLIAVLVFRPSGLLGERVGDRA